jgi:hypothetical protein
MSLLGTSSDDSWLINIALLGSRGIGYFIVTYLYGVFWIPNPTSDGGRKNRRSWALLHLNTEGP